MAAKLKLVLAASGLGAVNGCSPPICSDGSTPAYAPYEEEASNWAWASEQCTPDSKISISVDAFWTSCHNPGIPQVHSPDVCEFAVLPQASHGPTTLRMNCLTAGVCKIAVSAKVDSWDMTSCPKESRGGPVIMDGNRPAPIGQSKDALERWCCQSLNAECQACKKGITIEAFCAQERNKELCSIEATDIDVDVAEKGKTGRGMCCGADSALCLSCKKGQTVEVFCSDPRNAPHCEDVQSSGSDELPSLPTQLPPDSDSQPLKPPPKNDNVGVGDPGIGDPETGEWGCCRAYIPSCEACRHGLTRDQYCAAEENRKFCDDFKDEEAPASTWEKCRVLRNSGWKWWGSQRCLSDCNGDVCHRNCERRCNNKCRCSENVQCSPRQGSDWTIAKCRAKCMIPNSSQGKCNSRCNDECSECICNDRRLSEETVV